MNALSRSHPRLAWTGPSESSFELKCPDIPFIEQLFESRMLRGREGQPIPLEVYIPELEGQLLYSLVTHLTPQVTLEVGLANGISATYVAQALKDLGAGRHIAIDPYQQSDWHEAGLVTLEQARLDAWVTLDARPSHWALPEMEKNGLRIQFAFVDGSHQFDYVMTDFLGIDRVLDVGGLIAFDDSDWPAVTKVIRYALANHAYELFDTGVVVEPSRHNPRLASRWLRGMVGHFPKLGRILREDFVVTSHQLGIRGRCVVLRKLDEDRRDSQSQFLVGF